MWRQCTLKNNRKVIINFSLVRFIDGDDKGCRLYFGPDTAKECVHVNDSYDDLMKDIQAKV